MKIEQFIRKLNNTELNFQNTNDAYVRLSKDIQDNIPQDFFDELNSKNVQVINKKSMKPVENWVRYQYYPSNKEYRIANLSCIYKSYKSSSGDYLYIEKIQNESNIHFEIYMKNYQKICLKYSKSTSLLSVVT